MKKTKQKTENNLTILEYGEATIPSLPVSIKLNSDIELYVSLALDFHTASLKEIKNPLSSGLSFLLIRHH